MMTDYVIHVNEAELTALLSWLKTAQVRVNSELSTAHSSSVLAGSSPVAVDAVLAALTHANQLRVQGTWSRADERCYRRLVDDITKLTGLR